MPIWSDGPLLLQAPNFSGLSSESFETLDALAGIPASPFHFFPATCILVPRVGFSLFCFVSEWIVKLFSVPGPVTYWPYLLFFPFFFVRRFTSDFWFPLRATLRFFRPWFETSCALLPHVRPVRLAFLLLPRTVHMRSGSPFERSFLLSRFVPDRSALSGESLF